MGRLFYALYEMAKVGSKLKVIAILSSVYAKLASPYRLISEEVN